MPFKANADYRHHIPKQKHKVTNWRAYDAALRQRSSLAVWFTDEAITAWRAERRTDRLQVTEVDVAVRALNRMLELGCPISVRIA